LRRKTVEEGNGCGGKLGVSEDEWRAQIVVGSFIIRAAMVRDKDDSLVP